MSRACGTELAHRWLKVSNSSQINADAYRQSGDEHTMSVYGGLLTDISDLSATLKLALVRTTQLAVEGPCYSSTIKCTLIKSLTAQAMLHRLLVTNGESRRMAAESVLEVVSVAEAFSDEEYLFMELTVGVSHSCFTQPDPRSTSSTKACCVLCANVLNLEHDALRIPVDSAGVLLRSGIATLNMLLSRLEVIVPFGADARHFDRAGGKDLLPYIVVL